MTPSASASPTHGRDAQPRAGDERGARPDLSGGRLVIGLGVGARKSGYLPAEREFSGRGKVFDRQLEFLHRAWLGEPVVAGDFPDERRPVAPAAGVPVLIGGHSAQAVA